MLSLVYICDKMGLHEVAAYWNAVVELNEYQKRRLSDNILKKVHSVSAKPAVAIFGASFKSGTSDTRESASM